jgi:hypothetical protein
MRAEEEQRHEMSERSTTRAQHPPSPTTRYQIPTPTAHPELNQEVYEGYGMAHEPAIAATSYDNDDDDDVSNHGDTPWYQPPIPIPDNGYPAPQLEHNGYDTANEYNEHIVLFDGYESGANPKPEHDSVIEQLVHELVVSGDTSRSWAEEMEEEMGFTVQGEYTPTTYSPTPAPPSPTPWHQPPPPTIPPQTHYAPPRTHYRYPHTYYPPRRPRFRPPAHTPRA